MLTIAKSTDTPKKSIVRRRKQIRELYRSFGAKIAASPEQQKWYTQKKQPNTLEEFFLRNGVHEQCFTIDTAKPAYITGEKGTELFIDPHSFVDMTGEAVEGSVQIHLKEVFRKSEIVLTNRPTTSQDKLLETGGALDIRATQNYMPLNLSKELMVEIPVSTRVANPLAMDIFRGTTSRRGLFAAQPTFDWIPSDKSQIRLRRSGNRSVFELALRELEWINCDYFFRTKEARTMVTAQYDNVSPLREQTAFLVFHDINAVARMYSKGDNRFTMFNLPVNHSATLLVFGLGQQGGMYFGKEKLEAISNEIINVTLHAVPEQEVVERIKAAAI